MDKYFQLLILCVFVFISCDRDTGSLTIPIDHQEEVEDVVESGDERYLTGDSDYIFDQQKLLTFELLIPIVNYEIINSDPAAEEYVEGRLVFEGDTIGPIGIRYKGSIGAFVNCVSGNNWANPSGHKTCTKLSMKLKMNWEDSDAQFYGLKKLQFHSMNLDDSQMRDRLGYWLFREMGVAAPRCVHARLMINGEYVGLFSLVEQIDGRFTRQNWDDGKGNLYKEVWPLDSDGNVQNPSNYLDALKTNEDENPSVDMISNFATEIKNADDNQLVEIVEKWMDTDAIISYVVVDRTIRHDDGPFHWYCNGNSCSPHNFYWYENPTENKLHLIPWDLDNAFENIISANNSVTNIPDEWGEISNNCNPFSDGFFGLSQKSAVCDKLVLAWTKFDEEFSQKKKEFVEGPLSESSIEMKLQEWETQISQATLEADDLHADAISFNQWNNSLLQLRDQLEFARLN